jgi:glutamate-1-semialdehyde 2,1-aminomutase
MLAGVAALRLLDAEAFARLDAMGERVRAGFNAAFQRHGVAGKAVGGGSLLKVHFASRDVIDYRSAFASPGETAALNQFNLGLLNRGVLCASYGLMALSTPMTDEDIEEIIRAADGAIADVAKITRA